MNARGLSRLPSLLILLINRDIAMNDEHTNSTGGCGCGSTMAEMTQDGCPCGSMLRNHRLAIFAILAVILVAFFISQVGGILGIAAFVRTL